MPWLPDAFLYLLTLGLPTSTSQPRSDVQPCAPVGIHLVLREPCQPSFLMVPQTGNPLWTGVSELRSSCALKREDLGKHLGDGQRREGLVGRACPWTAKCLCLSTAGLLGEPPPPEVPEGQCASGIRGAATQSRQTTHRQPLIPASALPGLSSETQEGSHVQGQGLGAPVAGSPTEANTSLPLCLGWGADLGKWAPRTFRWFMEKGCWPTMCEGLQGEVCPGRGSAGRKDRFGDSLMSPCNLGEPVGGFIIDWHQAEMPANCLQISHNCRRNKEQTG